MTKELRNNFSGIEINLTIDKENYKSELYTDLIIDDNDLDDEFMEQPRKFAWWAAVEALAKDLYEVKKMELKRLYAITDANARAEGKASRTKKTEKMVENEVLTNQEYQIAENALAEIRKQYNLAHAGKEAFEQRKEMLISLGANYRAEVSADPTIMKERAKLKAIRLAKDREQKKEKKINKIESVNMVPPKSVQKRIKTQKAIGKVGKSVGKKKKGV